MPTLLADMALERVVAMCRRERSSYSSAGVSESPACVEIFRRAFDGSADAWEALQGTFGSLMRRWVGDQRAVDPEEVIQEALLAFFRVAPGLHGLLAADELGRVLGYLRSCVKSALLTQCRKRQVSQVSLDGIAEAPSSGDIADAAETRIILLARVAQLIESDQERLVFEAYFRDGLRPQEIAEQHRPELATVAFVNTIVQRLTRRLRKDPVLQQLRASMIAPRQKPGSGASHEIRALADEQEHTPMDGPCLLEDDLLLEYILGRASAETRAAVERTPACLRAARALAHDLAPLLGLIYRAECPAPDTLVGYHERSLGATEQLIVRRHVAACPNCRAELALLDTVDRAPLLPEPGLLRRVIAAALAPAPQLALRGELRHYTTPQITLMIGARQAAGRAHSWTLRGEARTPEGLQAAGQIEMVLLQPATPPDAPEQLGEIAPTGAFVFRDLVAGAYRLRVLTADTEIVIAQIEIGDEP